jgi:hypothetical protein
MKGGVLLSSTGRSAPRATVDDLRDFLVAALVEVDAVDGERLLDLAVQGLGRAEQART